MGGYIKKMEKQNPAWPTQLVRWYKWGSSIPYTSPLLLHNPSIIFKVNNQKKKRKEKWILKKSLLSSTLPSSLRPCFQDQSVILSRLGSWPPSQFSISLSLSWQSKLLFTWISLLPMVFPASAALGFLRSPGVFPMPASCHSSSRSALGFPLQSSPPSNPSPEPEIQNVVHLEPIRIRHSFQKRGFSLLMSPEALRSPRVNAKEFGSSHRSSLLPFLSSRQYETPPQVKQNQTFISNLLHEVWVHYQPNTVLLHCLGKAGSW